MRQRQLAAAPNAAHRVALRASFHLRRFLPLYVVGVVWLVVMLALPSVEQARDSSAVSTASGSLGTTDPGATAASGDPAIPAEGGPAAGPAGGGTAAGPGAATAGGGGVGAGGRPGAAAPPAAVQVGSGTTRGGYPCTGGVRQVPFSAYAPPCVARFSGSNGGATYRGVTADSIKIAVRVTADQGGPNSQAVDQVSTAAGQATAEQDFKYASALLPWFNKNFELYGRKVVFEKFGGQGNGTDEAQNRGQEAACADATAIATSVKAFGDVAYGFGYESGPFADCAARQKLYIPFGAAYFPESYYKKWDPYVWGGVTECERISHDVAEYAGKRLLNRKARWAGDPTYRAQNRKMGTYVPNNDPYQYCVNIYEKELRSKYNAPSPSRYNYALDVSQFPSEAERGVLQFHADGVTTLTLACDAISQIFLTRSAKQQNWNPEWFIIGVATQDTDGYGRLDDPDEVNGHMFGMSQLGDDFKINDKKNGEAGRAWKEATGTDMPQGAALDYFGMVELFTQLQAAGPVLTPANIAAATHRLPPAGGSQGAVGTWSWATSHTGIIDSREVYWDPNALGYDGNPGHWVATNGGKRFTSGQWSTDEPAFYPAAK